MIYKNHCILNPTSVLLHLTRCFFYYSVRKNSALPFLWCIWGPSLLWTVVPLPPLQKAETLDMLCAHDLQTPESWPEPGPHCHLSTAESSRWPQQKQCKSLPEKKKSLQHIIFVCLWKIILSKHHDRLWKFLAKILFVIMLVALNNIIHLSFWCYSISKL